MLEDELEQQKKKLEEVKRESAEKYNNLCIKLKYAEVDLTMDDSGVAGDEVILIE